MQIKSNLILTVPPTDSRVAEEYGLTPGHMAYRVGGGPHLFRANQPMPARGGLMVIDSRGFDGRGEPDTFCHEVMRECSARGFQGAICDFEGRPFQVLAAAVRQLGELMHSRGWSLYVTEAYAPYSDKTKVLISTALSGGSLAQRLGEAADQYGAGRVALAVERVAEDFFLPSPTGLGSPITREELKKRREERAPTVFFSNELCAHYFTYMSKQSGAHFILFDDAGSIRKKLHVARTLDILDAVLAYPEVEDILEEILV